MKERHALDYYFEKCYNCYNKVYDKIRQDLFWRKKWSFIKNCVKTAEATSDR